MDVTELGHSRNRKSRAWNVTYSLDHWEVDGLLRRLRCCLVNHHQQKLDPSSPLKMLQKKRDQPIQSFKRVPGKQQPHKILLLLFKTKL